MVSPQKNWQEQQEQLNQNPLNRKDKQELFKMRSAKNYLVRANSKLRVS